jgi:hypothetical protein
MSLTTPALARKFAQKKIERNPQERDENQEDQENGKGVFDCR